MGLADMREEQSVRDTHVGAIVGGKKDHLYNTSEMRLDATV